MGKSNKNARKDLESIYGKKDMFTEAMIEQQIDELNKTRKRKIKTYREYKQQCRFTSSKEKSMERMLSYHHLRHKQNGGKADVQNGALLSALPHSYLHSLPRDEEEIINNMLREYKANFGIHCATLVLKDKGIEIDPIQETEETLELPPEIEAGVIEVEFNSPEEQRQYEEYKKKKVAEKYKKFGVIKKAHIDEEWQKEIIQDVIDELRY